MRAADCSEGEGIQQPSESHRPCRSSGRGGSLYTVTSWAGVSLAHPQPCLPPSVCPQHQSVAAFPVSFNVHEIRCSSIEEEGTKSETKWLRSDLRRSAWVMELQLLLLSVIHQNWKEGIKVVRARAFNPATRLGRASCFHGDTACKHQGNNLLQN